MGIMSKNEAEQRFKDLLSELNKILAQSVKNANGSQQSYYTNVKAYNGTKQPTRYSYGFGSINKTVTASISYEEFIKTTNYGVLVPYFMAIGRTVVSDAVKTPAKYNAIESELMETDKLLQKLKTRNTTITQNNSLTCRTQCFGGCSGNCFHTCKGSCATNCANNCGESCSDMCYSSCKGRCDNTCSSKCISGCSGTCQGTCNNQCKGCRSTCSGCSGCQSCSGVCDGGCSGGCTSSCGGCASGCSGGCKSGCSGCSGGTAGSGGR